MWRLMIVMVFTHQAMGCNPSKQPTRIPSAKPSANNPAPNQKPPFSCATAGCTSPYTCNGLDAARDCKPETGFNPAVMVVQNGDSCSYTMVCDPQGPGNRIWYNTKVGGAWTGPIAGMPTKLVVTCTSKNNWKDTMGQAIEKVACTSM